MKSNQYPITPARTFIVTMLENPVRPVPVTAKSISSTKKTLIFHGTLGRFTFAWDRIGGFVDAAFLEERVASQSGNLFANTHSVHRGGFQRVQLFAPEDKTKLIAEYRCDRGFAAWGCSVMNNKLQKPTP